MHKLRRVLVLGTVAMAIICLVRPVNAQTTHVVRMSAEPSKNSYRFEPAELSVKPGDVLVFRVAAGAPHSVVFEPAGLSSATIVALNSAMPERTGQLSSPLLTATGKEYRMVVPEIPAGRYSYYCLPHRAYDMRGALVIK
jgi:plastocyanin